MNLSENSRYKYFVPSPVRHQLVALLARSVSIVTGRQPIEQLEGYDVIG